MNERDLLRLKEQIDEAKSKVSQLQGRKEYLMQQLKKDWDCTTIRQAQSKMEELKTAVTELDNQIKQGIAKLEEQLNDSQQPTSW